MGVQVEPGQDHVTLDGKSLKLPERHRYFAYNKPRGILVSRRSQGGKPTLYDALGDQAHGLHPVGRLDYDSEGLLILTDDGDLSEALLHPRTALLRRYRVWVTPVPDPGALRMIQAGAVIEGVHVAPLHVVHEGVDGGRGVIRIDLTEGKKREVRVLVSTARLSVERLLRIRFGPVRLGTEPAGTLRPLRGQEIAALRR